MEALVAAYLAMLCEQDLERFDRPGDTHYRARLDALVNPAGVAIPAGQTEVMIP